MDVLSSIDTLQLFLVFVIPGFISLKIWSLLVPMHRIVLKESIFEVICYSFVNFALLFWVIGHAEKIGNPEKTLLYIVILFVAPIIWPILWKILLTSKIFAGRIIHPTPKAWDYFFSLGKPCFMLLHLKTGELIGGLYHDISFASSYPEEEDLYIKEVWKIDEDGKFKEKVKGTEGLLIKYNIVDYIELFSKFPEGEKTNVE